jgi:hypothetical protein
MPVLKSAANKPLSHKHASNPKSDSKIEQRIKGISNEDTCSSHNLVAHPLPIDQPARSLPWQTRTLSTNTSKNIPCLARKQKTERAKEKQLSLGGKRECKQSFVTAMNLTLPYARLKSLRSSFSLQIIR